MHELLNLQANWPEELRRGALLNEDRQLTGR